MIISFSALTLVAGNVHGMFTHPIAVVAGDSTSDPIATGNWQQDQYALESQFNTWAVSEVINSGCDYTHDEGLMQVNPYCQQTGSADLFDPATSIYHGTAQLSSAYWQLGSMDLALQAYNIGLPNVLSGARNWAYSSATESYVQEFENEHCAVYGCWTPSSTTANTARPIATLKQRKAPALPRSLKLALLLVCKHPFRRRRVCQAKQMSIRSSSILGPRMTIEICGCQVNRSFTRFSSLKVPPQLR